MYEQCKRGISNKKELNSDKTYLGEVQWCKDNDDGSAHESIKR